MKHDPLVGALPIIAKALGRRLGVNVVIGARSQAGTDGQTIDLPPLAVLANGFIDHEAAHVRYTDFTVAKPAGLAGLLTNLLEDIRVERALGAAYPGSRRNLAALVDHLESQEPAVPPPDAPVLRQVLGALLYLLRARLLGQTALAAGAAALEARLDARLPEGAVVQLLALAFEVRHATSTAAVIALAERIVAMLHEEAQPPPPDDPVGTGRSAGSGDPGGRPPSLAGDPAGSPPASSDASIDRPPSLAGDPAGNPPAASGAPTHAGPSAPAGDPAGNPPAPSGAPTGGSSPAAGEPAEAGPADSPAAGAAGAGSPNARHAALVALLAAGETDAVAGLDVGARAGARLNALAAGHPEARTGLAEYGVAPPNLDPAAAVARARAATALLRRRLGVLVQAQRDEDAWRARRGRRLDPASLYRPSAGQPVRFVRRAARDAPETAVGLLLDRSSSMRGAMALASQAVLATALALNELSGVACWVAAFPGAASDRVVPLVGFAERARRVAGRFDLGAVGGTPLATALWRAGYELSQRPEPRRLLVVATDGEPDDVGAAQQIIGRCRAGGIEVIGLGLGQHLAAVQAVFGARDATAITALAELAPALFALLERRLTSAG